MFGLFKRTPKQPKQYYWTVPGGEYDLLSAEVLTAPHTLIAGTTGCGKSTFLHSVMRALLVQHSPASAKLVLIDPKRVELRQYAYLPHTIGYAETPADALSALESAHAMMEQRYRRMVRQGLKTSNEADVYIIIDELADLMLSAEARHIKPVLQSLLQLGRASRIHVIACTQCPNRKVIEAQLVCNFTNRFGLRCVSPIESRQIIGVKGCESLPEHGQAWYVKGCHVGKYVLPFVTDADIRPLINYWMSDAAYRVA